MAESFDVFAVEEVGAADAREFLRGDQFLSLDSADRLADAFTEERGCFSCCDEVNVIVWHMSKLHLALAYVKGWRMWRVGGDSNLDY